MEPAIAQRVGKLKVDATNEEYKQVTKKNVQRTASTERRGPFVVSFEQTRNERKKINAVRFVSFACRATI